MKIRTIMLAGLLCTGGCESNSALIVTSPVAVGTLIDTNGITNAVLFAATDPFIPVASGVVIDPAAAANAAANAVGTYFPSGCATATVTGTTVTYNLNQCTGPLGLTGLTGTYAVTYTTASNGIQVSVASTNLVIGTAVFKLNAQALYTQAGTARQLAVTNNSIAIGADGNQFAQNQTGTLTWTQGDVCTTQNSRGTTVVNGNTITQVDSNIVRCANRCPTSGTVAVTDNNSNSGTVTFDGSPRPNMVVTSSGNTTVAVVLACPGA